MKRLLIAICLTMTSLSGFAETLDCREIYVVNSFRGEAQAKLYIKGVNLVNDEKEIPKGATFFSFESSFLKDTLESSPSIFNEYMVRGNIKVEGILHKYLKQDKNLLLKSTEYNKSASCSLVKCSYEKARSLRKKLPIKLENKAVKEIISTCL